MSGSLTFFSYFKESKGFIQSKLSYVDLQRPSDAEEL